MGKKLVTALIWTLSLVSLGMAQIDPGTPDTIRVGTATATAYGQQVMVNVFGYNDEELAGYSIPIKFNGVALIPDSVSYLGGRLASAPVKPVTIDTSGQTVFFGAIFFTSSVPPGSGLLAKLFFTVKNGVAPDTIDLDSFFLPPAQLSLVEPNANEFVPQFVPGKVFVNVPPLPQPHDPVLTVPGPQQVFGGFNISFGVTAVDVDTQDILTITKSGIPAATFSHVPKKSPASGSFSWNTTPDDTLTSPDTVTFIVDDGTGRADTAEVVITVLPFITPPGGLDGDINGDGDVNLEDVIYLVNYVFHDGPPGNPEAVGDINGDCFITVADIIYLSNYILKGGNPPVPWCLPGDVNHDGQVNLADIIYYINYLLLSGQAPVSFKSSDVNVDCSLNLSDVVFLVNYIFRGGPEPQPGCDGPIGQAASATAEAVPAELGWRASKIGDGILEVYLDLNLTQSAAALMVKVEYDPAKLKGLPPRITTRSQNLDLHYKDSGSEQTVGLLDILNNNSIAAGQGTVLVLRFQVLNFASLQGAVRITYSEVVAPSAVPFEVRMVKELEIQGDQDK
ncbi:MAG: hypothetical protein A2Z27_03920 [candidate division Zixibacteria bacterium RBG_16_50_21]|nr:MAG: hypothetical protein A2Z27_03920 [candidate division Zixibacteria bacterium RBG_16_50_21]